MAKASIKVDGMSCMHCVGRVKQAVTAVTGVKSADVQVGSADVEFDEARTSQADIEAAITKAGYKIKK